MKRFYPVLIFTALVIHATFSQTDLPWQVEFSFETGEHKNFISLDSSAVWQVESPPGHAIYLEDKVLTRL